MFGEGHKPPPPPRREPWLLLVLAALIALVLTAGYALILALLARAEEPL